MQRSRVWIEQFAADTPSRKRGNSALRCLVAESGDGIDGYALYRTKADYDRTSGLPNGTVFVLAQSSTSVGAHVALTRELMSIDLMRTVRWWNQPVDTSLPHLLTDPRRARTTVKDALHLRIVDVAPALEGRRYLAAFDVVIGVRDDRLAWNDGAWRLTVDDSGVAKCARVDDEPDLRLGVEDLGAAFLGGTSLLSLAATGRVTATDAELLSRVSTGFGWPVAPWCPIVF
jgi:predicted acetyltransferase